MILLIKESEKKKKKKKKVHLSTLSTVGTTIYTVYSRYHYLSQILQLPIMVITLSEVVSYLPFVPDSLTSKEPAFVAFHYYGAGHYVSTKTSEG